MYSTARSSGLYGLVLVHDAHPAADSGDVLLEITHIAVPQVADAGVRAGAEAHIILQCPVFDTLSGLIPRRAEIRDLVLLVAVALQQLRGVAVHVGLLVVIGEDGRTVIVLVHLRPRLELQPVAGKMLGVQLDDLGERLRPVGLHLARQTVYKVETHVVEAGLAGVGDSGLRLLEIVPAADELQKIVVRSLNADGQAVDALLAQELQSVEADAVRVDLDSDLRVKP